MCGPNLSQIAPSGPKCPQMAANGPKWPQMVPNGPKWSQMVPNGTKYREDAVAAQMSGRFVTCAAARKAKLKENEEMVLLFF